MTGRFLSSVAILALGAGAVTARSQAADSIGTLGQFGKTGTGPDAFRPVDQNGDYARQLKANLEGITLPPGFSIDLFAVVPDARHIAVGQQGVAIFVGTRKQDVWVATDRDKDRRADEVKRFAPSVQFNVPNRPCFSRDGVLYVAE